MKTQLENMGLDYQAPVIPGKAPSRPKKGASKKGKGKPASSRAKGTSEADAPAAPSGKENGRSSPRRIKPQRVPSEKNAPADIPPETEAPGSAQSDHALDIDEVPLSHRLKRKADDGESAHGKKQRTGEEAHVPAFVEKWLQPPRHKVVVECSDRSALERS
ncbi:unnamed protein product [Linum trigynum]|uniref:Uncharacterized protein n=1 Tax=Linum trigynum TaxID=586398 RepID=A0AAV2ES45_9ROSI